VPIDYCGGTTADGSMRFFVKPNCISYKVPGVEPPVVQRDNGPPCNCEPQLGKPINPATGNMWHQEKDYAAKSPSSFAVVRTYNSEPYPTVMKGGSGFGVNWSQPYQARLSEGSMECWEPVGGGDLFCDTLPSASKAWISRGDGKIFLFRLSAGKWTTDVDINSQLVMERDENQKKSGWKYTTD
jgi:hypothetical protein